MYNKVNLLYNEDFFIWFVLILLEQIANTKQHIFMGLTKIF
jgi:hypothetical protein